MKFSSLAGASRSLSVAFSFAILLAVSPARGEDINVSESQANSFSPEKITEVKILDDSRHPSTVKKIRWRTDSIRVITRQFGSSSESKLILEGELKRENSKKWHLVWNNMDTRLDQNGRFKLEIPFDPGMKSIQLVAIAPKGEVEYHFYRYQLILPPPPESPPDPEGYRPVVAADVPKPPVQAPTGDAAKPVASESVAETPSESVSETVQIPVVVPGTADVKFNQKIDRRLFVSPGVGLSSIHFTQTGNDPYSSLVTTVKVSANYLLFPPKWDLGFTGFVNVASLSKSTTTDVRFLGLNLRVGYIFPQVTAPWRLSLYGGFYYSTMFASDRTFGYRNIGGPQLFPALRRTLSNGQGIGTYFKFSPISSNFGFLDLGSNEIAFGVSYIIPTAVRTYSISFDYAQMNLKIEDSQLNSRSLSLGCSATF